jgi:NAD(P)-dependent dehydrogenase (short-subunit alcohol dehydrogenase family)
MKNGATLQEKAALVTGGSRGLGRNTALNLAKEGFDVIITYRSRQDAADAVVAEIKSFAGCRAAALRLDTSEIQSFTGFVDMLRDTLNGWDRQGLHALINNAGVGLAAPFGETTETMFDELVKVHFKGVFFLTQKMLPVIADGGRIVNISSGLARVSLPGYSAYGAAKGAIEVLTRYLAKELGPRQITVNTVAPGGIETDFGGGVLRDNPDVNAFIASQTALGRAGVPDDVGPVIAALLSDSHRWVNAQLIGVSGGWLI